MAGGLAGAAVTFVLTVQLAPPVSDPPDILTELPPFVAVTVPPVHVVEVTAGFVLVKPAGYVSEKATLFRVSFGFGFMMVKVKVEIPPVTIGFGANNLEMTGGRTAVRFAVA